MGSAGGRKKQSKSMKAEDWPRPGDDDAIEADPSTISDLAERKKSDQKFRSLLEAAPDAMVVVDRNSKILLVNTQAVKVFGWSKEELVGRNIDMLVPERFRDRHTEARHAFFSHPCARPMGADLELFALRKDATELPVEISLSPLETEEGMLVISAIRDVTTKRKHAQEILRLSRLYQALSQVNQAITTTHERQELFVRICHVLVEFGGLKMAWIGWLDTKTRQVKPVGKWGDSTDYLSQWTVYADAQPEGQGPTGTAIREERAYICNDFGQVPRTLRCREAAEKSNFLASAAFPIRQGGVVCGALSVYAAECGFFQDREIKLLNEAANDLSFALDNLVHEEARRKSDAALRRSEAELIEAQRLAHLGSWRLDVGSSEVFWTAELYRMLGLDPTLPPPPYTEHHRLFTPKSWQSLRTSVQHTLETGEPYELELEMIRADGSNGWMRARGERIQDAQGAILGLRGVAQDITLRKQAAVALLQSQNRLRGIIDGIGPSMFVGLMTDKGVLIEANRSALAAARLNLEDVIGKPFEETYWWAYSPEVQEQLRAAISRAARGEASRYDVRVRTAENQLIDIDFSLQPLRDESGKVAFLIPSASVITERKRVEEELRWKTAFLEAQVDSSLDGILVVDAQRKQILQNQRTLDLWKIPPDLVRSQDDAEQTHFAAKRAKDPQRFAEKVAWLNSHPDEVSRDEIELVDGTILDRYSSPVRDKAGKYYGRIWTFRDVTEHRKLEAQLYQSQKIESIGQLAGGIAHDFNNIIGAIMMQTEFTSMFANSPEKVRAGLWEIKVAAERAANLTRQLLLFSRQQVMQAQQLDLNELVTGLANMLRRVIREDVSLELQLHSTPLLIQADAGMLEQVLVNLAVNARDAMPNGGQIIIKTAEKVFGSDLLESNPEAAPGRYAWLSVTDTGCGMPPEIQSHIFEPFFTTKELGKGTGLGLATVFGIVKQHHGWLRVDSEVGKGTGFQIFLPVSAGPVQASLIAPSKPKPCGGTEAILLAEDSPIVRRLTRTVLEGSGYEVVEAADGVAAELAWSQHQGKVALLLTDLIMPGGLGGRELAARLQRKNPTLKVLFTSGYSPEIAGRQLKLDAKQMFLQKPFSSGELLQAVRKCLDL